MNKIFKMNLKFAIKVVSKFNIQENFDKFPCLLKIK